MTSPYLDRAARQIARLTNNNSRTKAVITGIRFLVNHVLPDGSLKRAGLAKIKALDAIYKGHIDRGFILPEEMQYRHAAGEWMDAVASENMRAADAEILKGAF